MNTHKLLLSLLSCSALTAAAQNKSVYSLDAFGPDLMELFAKVEAEGRKYPTIEELEEVGVHQMDLAFVRSHEQVRPILSNADMIAVNGVVPTRKLWMNIPIGIGKYQGGYPTSNWSDDPYTGWNYTAVFGTWNHGLFSAPGCVVDAAHRNGTDIYSGIKFFESWTPGSTPEGWLAFIKTKDSEGYDGFKYVRPLVNAMRFFGHDGLNYNFEASGYADSDVVKFHQACYKYAKEIGFSNFHIGIYTQASSLNSGNCEALLGKNGVKTADAFLNYVGGNFNSATNMRKSIQAAEQYFGSSEGVYQGALLSGLERGWTNFIENEDAKKMGIVVWGEHGESRIHSWCLGEDGIDFQEAYQRRQEYFFSGGNRNVAALPNFCLDVPWRNESDLKRFHGLAKLVPERSTVQQDLPFNTFFNIGNGERYYYKGKATLGGWYNMGAQDILPTYRWMVYKKGTTFDANGRVEGTALGNEVPALTNADAYTGGSCIRLENTADADIILYRCELTVSGANPTATLAWKVPQTAQGVDGKLTMLLRKRGGTDWIEVPFGRAEGHAWNAASMPVGELQQGDVIEYIALRTSGIVNGMLVGQVGISDDTKRAPAAVTNLIAEVKEETQQSLSVRLCWDINATPSLPDFDMTLNADGNIDHYEILYKNGEKGRVSEVARTTSWGAYVGNIPMAEDEKPFVGVRAASTDGCSYSDIEWVEIPRAAAAELPAGSIMTDDYPAIYLDLNAEDTDVALKERWVKSLTAKNADEPYTYTNNVGTPYMRDIAAGMSDDKADKTNYLLAEEPLRVTQGQQLVFTINVSPKMAEQTVRAYVDWDGDHRFNVHNDELAWQSGISNDKKSNTAFKATTTFGFNVPADAKPGLSRLRIATAHPWFPHSGPTGGMPAGFALDVPVVISGDNAPREAAIDTHDAGIADEPEGMVRPDAIHPATPMVSRAEICGKLLKLEHVEKVWVYAADGRLARHSAASPQSLPLDGLASGVYVVRMQCGSIIRSQQLILP